MLRFDYQRHTLRFTFVAGTSRGVLTEKDTYFLRVYDDQSPDMQGWGECSTLPGLSIDHVPNYEAVLGDFCEISNKTAFGAQSIKEAFEAIPELIPNAYPSIVFGFETALLDLANGGRRVLFDTPFARGEAGIAINGLVWMGEPAFMKKQIDEKLAQGYTTLKLKIGAIDFAQECALLAYIREHFPPERITLRVDANGAFRPDEAMRKLEKLAAFGLHSIEQPIAAGQWVASRELCARSPVPVALDEELIGVMERGDKIRLLETIRPPFVILKPSLLGGFAHCREWIELAETRRIGWWMTSALESNVGLNAIAQFMASLGNPLPQGLGTGQLYHNNVPSPLEIRNGFLHYNPTKSWVLGLEPWAKNV
jgi:o-succinylbenzoate synthase